MGLLFDDEYRENDADFEACVPLRRKVDATEVSVRELEGGAAICLKHRGPYHTIGRSYSRLFQFAKENHLERRLPSREVYLKGPGVFFRGNPKKYLTEIQILVRG